MHLIYLPLYGPCSHNCDGYYTTVWVSNVAELAATLASWQEALVQTRFFITCYISLGTSVTQIDLSMRHGVAKAELKRHPPNL
jgi:hypothetical protein